MAWYGGWRPYVPVANRRAQAARYAATLAKREKRTLAPIEIKGRQIARSFWGQAWCDNLEQYSDFENRLPRGRTYVRNGSVIDLQIQRGQVKALVSGSSIYKVTIGIERLSKVHWKRIKADCARSVDSLIDLLQGRFDQGVMQRLTRREGGLFPRPDEIDMACSCPDWAGMCKHVAAVLYGVGARLDASPELFFTLRAVDHMELISQAMATKNLDRTFRSGRKDALADQDLGELFGIELDGGQGASRPSKRRPDSDTTVKPSGSRRAKSAQRPQNASQRGSKSVVSGSVAPHRPSPRPKKTVSAGNGAGADARNSKSARAVAVKKSKRAAVSSKRRAKSRRRNVATV